MTDKLTKFRASKEPALVIEESLIDNLDLKQVIKEIKDEAFQKQLVDKIVEKVTFPNVSKIQQTKFTNEVYDATQELLVEFVTNL